MPRPVKCRRVGYIPKCLRFVPDNFKGILEEVTISFEEIEAIRLSDLEGLDQNESSERMGISRGTFQRIINSARQKISDALVNGKTIRIEGGCYKREQCTLVCKSCGNKLEVHNCNSSDNIGMTCAKCQKTEFRCEDRKKCCIKKCGYKNT